MDTNMRHSLERLALERLTATKSDVEAYSFLFRTEGSIGLTYCPWSAAEDFDGEIDGLDLPWSRERIELIEAGADPTPEELRQWREALCLSLADGSDWTVPAWIVPIWTEGVVAGHALFLCEDETAPRLVGVYETVELARTALAAEGAIARDGATPG
jgi:hypothetical protein